MVIMTATPIFDKPAEIALTINLLSRKYQMPTGSEFIDQFITAKKTKHGTVYGVQNMDLFKEYVVGYVSYFRGAPAVAFPRSEMKVVKCKMSDHQTKLYKSVDRKESKKESLKQSDRLNISNSFFIGTRMVSNIAYPNTMVGEDGYESLTDDDLKISNMLIYSPKFVKIMRAIKKCEGTVFVYSNFKEFGGLKPFALFLEKHGYKNYEGSGAGPKRFAIWSGDQDISMKGEIKAVYNNKKNKDGSSIKVILGSAAAKEGVSFYRTQEVHMMEPYWNWSRMDQVIGRAIRFCSHRDMPPEKRNVKVYIYASVHPTVKTSIDEYILGMAYEKKKINNYFEQAIKEAAVDCKLFKNTNVHPGEDPINCQE
jgi:hypothetical protein